MRKFIRCACERYWGKLFGTRGYFCVTSGKLTKEMIQEYLEHHFEKDPNDHFDIASRGPPAIAGRSLRALKSASFQPVVV